ncbi:MFS transporter [Microvirga sp. ACRRW]|uniref:MFS transporter n=1 Tax=Microvirga sp. ACRRW TaxID=2918205 RepID=UPI001EF4B380|nr:MFS transporter [Microvirga sp. ACRRW]MCG7391557.1 MFS transporter [Microvirga sp. ACRRW]
MNASSTMPRAGRLDCLCEPIESAGDLPDRGGTALLAVAFALSVLSQVLTLTILPLAGLSLAPSGTWATLPYAAFYAGAALASLPASLLLDAFGRRAAFSLGASLGVAGGLMTAWALLQWQFTGLVLGAFWLGIASGFSLFYRHAAAPLGAKGKGSILVVFGAATLAGLLAPTVANMAEGLAVPHTLVGMAAAAALAHVGSLLATAALPYQRMRRKPDEAKPLMEWRRILWPSLIGALGWFSMTALMGATPIAMVGCGLGEAVSGTIAWHVIAMYAPSLVLAGLPQPFRPTWIAFGGCALLMTAALAFLAATSIAAFTLSTALLGIGWSLVTMGTTLWVHEKGEPSRWLLGLHDGILLGSALLGALAAGIMQ